MTKGRESYNSRRSHTHTHPSLHQRLTGTDKVMRDLVKKSREKEVQTVKKKKKQVGNFRKVLSSTKN